VHPNPLVGAVLVRDGELVGEGWHAEYGAAHAEVAALGQAGEAAAGATLYVTLEPCAHHGQTPPCTAAIMRAGVRRVVYAVADPNPRARGGAEVLRAAGIDVIGGVERARAREQNRIFLHIHERRRCYVALKLAISLDARLGERGVRTRLSGPAADASTHRLRAGFDAILVGRETAAVDDPLLTVRTFPARVPPMRIVLDAEARLSPTSRLATTTSLAPTTVVCATDATPAAVATLEAAGVAVLRAPRGPRGLDVAAALDALWQQGVRSVLCEGGGRVAASLLEADVVERLHLIVAPRLIGESGVPAFPQATLPDPAGWRLRSAHTIGDDAVLEIDRLRDDEA
jgi:diaminohydroxyphosphoribosylaminopyrimidine deaminase / 5-amino-6-(5-phosphoribosylamino)uracil reductase